MIDNVFGAYRLDTQTFAELCKRRPNVYGATIKALAAQSFHSSRRRALASVSSI